MAAKPLTTETIALTEKKMNMALDDIIKLSKNAGTKSKSRQTQRMSNKNKKVLNNQTQNKAMKVRHFMDSRSSLKQAALAKRRSNFQGNHFPLATEAAQKAIVAPLHNRAFGHNRIPNWNKQRVGAPVQSRPANRGYPPKQGNVMPKQRPKTLDSLFANMREQRMRAISNSRQNNVVPTPRNGAAQQHWQPWRRGRFGN